MGRTARELTGRGSAGPGAPAREPSLLERLVIGPGATVLCLGCPDAGALDALSRWTGPSGMVTVVETDASVSAAARVQVFEHGLSNVELLWRATWPGELRQSSFDVVQLQRPLTTVPRLRRRRLLRRALALAKPGGWIVSRERRSQLGRSPWAAVSLYDDCELVGLYDHFGLVGVSTEPVPDELVPSADGEVEYLVWGRKPCRTADPQDVR